MFNGKKKSNIMENKSIFSSFGKRVAEIEKVKHKTTIPSDILQM